MTKYVEVGRVGPCSIQAVEAEILNTSTKYIFECEECGSAMTGVESQNVAEREAVDHIDRNHDRTNSQA